MIKFVVMFVIGSWNKRHFYKLFVTLWLTKIFISPATPYRVFRKEKNSDSLHFSDFSFLHGNLRFIYFYIMNGADLQRNWSGIVTLLLSSQQPPYLLPASPWLLWRPHFMGTVGCWGLALRSHLPVYDQLSGLAELCDSQQQFRRLEWAEGRSLGIVSEWGASSNPALGAFQKGSITNEVLLRSGGEWACFQAQSESPRLDCQLAPRAAGKGGTNISLWAHWVAGPFSL